MSNQPGVSKKGLLLFGLAVVVVAIVGGMAGSWFVGWRQDRAWQKQADRTWTGGDCLLQAGEAFPSVDMVSLDATPANTTDLLNGKRTLVLFLAVGCGPCGTAIEEWKGYADKLPDDLQIIGIAASEISETKAYRERTGCPFPLYCDTSYTFADEYEMNQFPTLVGLTEQGLVAFVRQGYREGFTPIDAYALYASVAPGP